MTSSYFMSGSTERSQNFLEVGRALVSMRALHAAAHRTGRPEPPNRGMSNAGASRRDLWSPRSCFAVFLGLLQEVVGGGEIQVESPDEREPADKQPFGSSVIERGCTRTYSQRAKRRSRCRRTRC